MKLFGWLIPGWAKLAFVALALGGSFYMGWHERGIRCENARLKANEAHQEALDKQRAKANDISAEYETSREQGRQEGIARETEIRTIYRDVPVPSECAAPDSVRSVLESAVESANARASGEPVAAVPADP